VLDVLRGLCRLYRLCHRHGRHVVDDRYLLALLLQLELLELLVLLLRLE
jgi:hypothetical protein